jgi:hypothetical protein
MTGKENCGGKVIARWYYLTADDTKHQLCLRDDMATEISDHSQYSLFHVSDEHYGRIRVFGLTPLMEVVEHVTQLIKNLESGELDV